MIFRREMKGMECLGVFFDFDGVLVDTEGPIYEAWLETFRGEGQELPLEIYTRCIGSDFDTWSPKRYLEELTGRVFDWNRMDEERQVKIMAGLEEQGPMVGVVEFLEELRERGVPVVVVSSSSHGWVDGWLDRLGLAGFFQETICRGDAARIKPAPDLYVEAAMRLGLEPGNCLAIEDSRNGMIAAHGAGMQVWIVPNRVTSGLDFTGADGVFQSLTGACEAFRSF